MKYCTHCGAETLDEAIACTKCGCPTKSGKKYCRNCGNELNENAIMCVKCGSAVRKEVGIELVNGVSNMMQSMPKPKLYMNIVRFVAAILVVLFFTMPLVQCKGYKEANASGWELATGTGDLFEMGGSGNALVFVLILVPALLLVYSIKNKSFSMFRNLSVGGLLLQILFMIIASAKFKDEGLELSGGNYILIIIYIGLCVFTHYCSTQEE